MTVRATVKKGAPMIIPILKKVVNQFNSFPPIFTTVEQLIGNGIATIHSLRFKSSFVLETDAFVTFVWSLVWLYQH